MRCVKRMLRWFGWRIEERSWWQTEKGEQMDYPIRPRHSGPTGQQADYLAALPRPDFTGIATDEAIMDPMSPKEISGTGRAGLEKVILDLQAELNDLTTALVKANLELEDVKADNAQLRKVIDLLGLDPREVTPQVLKEVDHERAVRRMLHLERKLEDVRAILESR